jgi:hypothetical protein
MCNLLRIVPRPVWPALHALSPAGCVFVSPISYLSLLLRHPRRGEGDAECGRDKKVLAHCLRRARTPTPAHTLSAPSIQLHQSACTPLSSPLLCAQTRGSELVYHRCTADSLTAAVAMAHQWKKWSTDLTKRAERKLRYHHTCC